MITTTDAASAIVTAISRADRDWCHQTADEPLDHDRLAHLAAGIQARRECIACSVPTVSQGVWTANTALRQTHARYAAHGMCCRCHGRARRAGTLPEPAPQKQTLSDDELARLRRMVGVA